MRVKSRVLYYPGFNPDPAWLRGVLLLYDEFTGLSLKMLTMNHHG